MLKTRNEFCKEEEIDAFITTVSLELHFNNKTNMVHLQRLASTFSSIAGRSKGLTDVVSRVASSAKPLNYRTILDSVGDDVDVVMLGEASHGTHEFYHHRAEITKLLILEKGFNLVGLEADYPDTHKVNHFVLNSRHSKDKTSKQALNAFDSRFPLWMWRNNVMVDFVDWLRKHNDSRNEGSDKTELYGLDVYSLEASRDAVLSFLDKYDPELPGLAAMAQEAYAGSSKRRGNAKDADRVLKELEKYHVKFPVFEELFVAIQNARCVKGAMDYYNNGCSWNTRDNHMFETVKQVMNRSGDVNNQRAKTVIWAHNSHLGNSLHTEMHNQGEINVGRLIKEHWGPERSMNIGFTTYDGSVTATHEWGSPCDFKLVNSGLSGSVEELFHNSLAVSPNNFPGNQFFLVFRSTGSKHTQADDSLVQELGTQKYEERAIGVIYRPKTERRSHYFDVKIAKQFDAVIHIDRTSALRPLDIPEQWSCSESILNTSN
jgi:erythromycin esterase-like protein